MPPEPMLVIPAIDLRDGRCVRLIRGDFNSETVYHGDPVNVARHWTSLGAPLIHIVDLDGARQGFPVQLDLVQQMVSVGARIELGWGLRRLSDLKAAMDAGVERLIIGTAAVENDLILRQAVSEFGQDSVILGVDARNGRAAVRGWLRTENVAATEVIERAIGAGVRRVVYTDIDRDGTLTAPNFDAVAAVAALGATVIASGGVSGVEDLRRLSAIPGVEAAIVGKALYEGAVRFEHPDDWWISRVDDGLNAEEHDGSQK
jgi:phosphoribosylformimino-5-aminoimidazole carboxamide ribotide isomerase